MTLWGYLAQQSESIYLEIYRTTLDFIVDLSWPLALIVIIFILRKQVRHLIGNIKRIKYGDGEVEFNEFLDEARQNSTDDPNENFVIPQDERLIRLADSYPRFAVVEAYSRIEKVAAQLSNKLGGPRYIRNDWFSWAIENNVLSKTQINALHSLRKARNLSAHSDSEWLTPSQAYEFIDIAESILIQLKSKMNE
ncbi:hypothetical protein [Roseibium sediminicola]|uniref:DUF4145 domain-containing protein n=1 Tax=Roseibium sediminicola TaxID=2933272 RepID=A0ABT0H307_9HYPH|nr:hypothetical protein [Roseibium sp. CAU 1639]MCK7616070.1 hypothetical protein [Roseibium sp. CAU 1639]